MRAPCALVQLEAGLAQPVSVYDFGLTNKTEADGMAVGLVSQYVARIVRDLLSGVVTVADNDLFRWLAIAREVGAMRLEPSAAAPLGGPAMVIDSPEGQQFLRENGLDGKMDRATHVFWTTGGDLVPEASYRAFLEKAEELAVNG